MLSGDEKLGSLDRGRASSSSSISVLLLVAVSIGQTFAERVES